MKKMIALLTAALLALSATACSTAPQSVSTPPADASRAILLSDDSITLDGTALAVGTEGDVTLSHDIVYYEAGHGEDYGEGTEEEAHSLQEAEGHTVVTIRTPGTYRLSGTLSAGQVAVDLGEGAEDDPEAVVTLILDNVDLTCTVAPAVIFYQVYECDRAWMDSDNGDFTAAADVDTSAAGARVILADGSDNTVTGSHVARIYQPGTTDKLHKYDAAFYSKMSMTVDGESEGTGKLSIVADNEGLDSELHLTINGGDISIQAQNDGINTNEDNVSVTTINGGKVWINAGLGEEGDGIDSNGYLVFNGGSVCAMGNTRAADGGVDADCAILVRGGSLLAMGEHNGAVSDNSSQASLAYDFAATLPEGAEVVLTDGSGVEVLSFTTQRDCRSLLISSPALRKDGSYTLTGNGEALTSSSTGGMGFPGGMEGGMGMGGGFAGMDIPEGLEDWLADAEDIPHDIRTWLEAILQRQQQFQNGGQMGPGGMRDPGQQTTNGMPPQLPNGQAPPEQGGAPAA